MSSFAPSQMFYRVLSTSMHGYAQILQQPLSVHCTKNESFSVWISSVNVKKATDLLTFTEEILNGKLNFLCSDRVYSIPVILNITPF